MNTTETINAAHEAGHLTKAAADQITAWLTKEKYAAYKSELEKHIENEAWSLLEDSFFQVIPFGTGGRRGTVGVGSNRINHVTIGESAQGLCNYALAQGEESKKQGIVIAYDTRTTSKDFAEYAASVCAANGFITYLFEDFRTTPELSFAVRHLGAVAGIVISASHNPPADNGFKAYWSDGGQVVPPHDKGVMDHVARVETIQTTEYTSAVAQGSIQLIGKEVDETYASAIAKQSVTSSRSVSIVYSPLHGTGIRNVVPALAKAGFENVTIVEEQAIPDGTFPTVEGHVANPEVRVANDGAIARAKEVQADIAITTDPDADRLGVLVRDRTGEYQFLTGNQIATLICYHILENLQKQDALKDNHFIVKTIVTTDFIDALSEAYGVEIYNDILIGFKYVAELIHANQDNGEKEFLFGGEESHGILKGSYTRDKDAAVAALMIAELASTCKDEGKTLLDTLNDLYRQYGLFQETLKTVMYEGAEGFTTMQRIMDTMRKSPPVELAGESIVRVIDRLDPQHGATGNVLIYHLSEDGHNRITIRPSGTEPKIKVYTQLHQMMPDSTSSLADHIAIIDQRAEDLTQALLAYSETV